MTTGTVTTTKTTANLGFEAKYAKPDAAMAKNLKEPGYDG